MNKAGGEIRMIHKLHARGAWPGEGARPTRRASTEIKDVPLQIGIFQEVTKSSSAGYRPRRCTLRTVNAATLHLLERWVARPARGARWRSSPSLRSSPGFSVLHPFPCRSSATVPESGSVRRHDLPGCVASSSEALRTLLPRSPLHQRARWVRLTSLRPVVLVLDGSPRRAAGRAPRRRNQQRELRRRRTRATCDQPRGRVTSCPELADRLAGSCSRNHQVVNGR